MSHRADVEAYIDGVLAGRIVVGNLVRQCVERHVRDLKTGASRGLLFSWDAADAVLDFFRFLRHSKGEWAGEPFNLQPWQKFRLACVFGWLKADTLARRFRIAYTEVARKNGKSTEAAGVGNFCLVADREPGAEIYTAATKFDQAKIVHGEAIRQVRSSKDIRKRVEIFKNNLSVADTDSKFLPLGADSKTLDGLNVHMAICDEVHAWPDGDLWDVLETATGARRQPLLYPITTAGWDRNSLCYSMHDHTEKVLNGTIEDDAWFGYIASLDPDDDWLDEGVWIKPNPNLGVSVKVDRIREGVAAAIESPARRNAFQRLRMNIWTQQATRWIDLDKWAACSGTIDLNALRGRRCYAGLDLSSTTDITAAVLDFPMDDSSHVWLPFFWCPEETAAEAQRRDRVPYLQWIAEGHLDATSGNIVDYDVVRAEFTELGKSYAIEEIAYDPWNATQIATQLEGEGFTMVQTRQGFQTFAPACAEFERVLAGKRLNHGGHPVLTWMAGNVSARVDPAGNIKPDKSTSTGKIDGIVAGLMALGRATVHGEQTSVYAAGGRGLLTI